MSIGLATDGYYGAGFSGGGEGGTITIVAVSPALNATPGSAAAFPADFQAAKKIPIVIDITDVGGSVGYIAVTVRYSPNDPESAAYRDDMFRGDFVLNSRSAAITNGVELSILPDDFWEGVPVAPGYIIADVDAIDEDGDTFSTQLIWQLPASSPAVVVVPAAPPGAFDHVGLALARVRQQFRDLSLVVRPDPAGPIARFTYGAGDRAVVFADGSSWSTAPVVSWLWDFGDSSTSIDENPSHAYAIGGVYPVSLTVTDSNGQSDTYVHSIQVFIGLVGWTLTTPATSPTPRYGGRLCYYPPWSCVVLLGGTVNGHTAIADGAGGKARLWKAPITDGVLNWVDTGIDFTAGLGGGLDYDSDREILVWFPADNDGSIGITEEFDGATVTTYTDGPSGTTAPQDPAEPLPSSPTPVASVWGAMAYDKTRRVMTYAAGFPGTLNAHIWEWDSSGKVWGAIAAPSSSDLYGMTWVYYPAPLNCVVGYGGNGSAGAANKITIYAGTDLTFQTVASPPVANDADTVWLAAAYNPERRTLLLKTATQTWEYNGTDFTRVVISSEGYVGPGFSAGGQMQGVMAYDVGKKVAVLYIGLAIGGGTPPATDGTYTLVDVFTVT